MQLEGIYDELPLHCTLMHRFWSELEPDILASKLDDFFKKIQPVLLKPHERLLLGPKQLPVSELELTDQLKELHAELYKHLNDLSVEYTAPEWVGEGYRAHVTERQNDRLELGDEHLSKAIYLIEVKVPGHDHKRIVRHKFDLQ